MMLLGGGATARCGTVRNGDDVTGQLGVVHGANQSNRFFFSVVKFGISQIRILVPSIKHWPLFQKKGLYIVERKGVYKTLPHYFRLKGLYIVEGRGCINTAPLFTR